MGLHSHSLLLHKIVEGSTAPYHPRTHISHSHPASASSSFIFMSSLNSPRHNEPAADELESKRKLLKTLMPRPAFREFARRYTKGYFTTFLSKYAEHHSKEEIWAIAERENLSDSPRAFLLATNKLLQENDNYKSPTAERELNLYCNQILEELREEYSNAKRYDVSVNPSGTCGLS